MLDVMSPWHIRTSVWRAAIFSKRSWVSNRVCAYNNNKNRDNDTRTVHTETFLCQDWKHVPQWPWPKELLYYHGFDSINLILCNLVEHILTVPRDSVMHMTSCQYSFFTLIHISVVMPQFRKHYSKDLKQRIIYQSLTLGYSTKEIAKNLDMSLRVVQQML